ncbi:MAG: hypothetical protein M1423_01620 [Acidobacteria bacterium]|nr:hypothetical protein [Acidobacteriota bacterium]
MPASLRSDRDRHGVGTSDRDQIGITDHLRRNQHFGKNRSFSLRFALVTQPGNAIIDPPAHNG